MWNSIVGHDAQLKRLEGDILSRDVHHAYLFVGPAEIGKTVVAKAFASYLQTGSPEFSPVTEAIHKRAHPDTLIFPASDGTLKVQDVRIILEKMHQSFSSTYHVCIVENIERMTLSAANCMLKALEEAPPGAVFILTSDKASRLLSTLVSRTRVVRFSDISRQSLLQYLEELREPKFSVKQIEAMLELSDGKMGRIFRFIHQPDYFDQFSKLYDETLRCLRSEDVVTRFRFVEDLLKAKDLELQKNIDLFFHAILHIVRVLMRQSGQADSQKVFRLFAAVERARKLIFETNVNKRLLLENLMIIL